MKEHKWNLSNMVVLGEASSAAWDDSLVTWACRREGPRPALTWRVAMHPPAQTGRLWLDSDASWFTALYQALSRVRRENVQKL